MEPNITTVSCPYLDDTRINGIINDLIIELNHNYTTIDIKVNFNKDLSNYLDKPLEFCSIWLDDNQIIYQDCIFLIDLKWGKNDYYMTNLPFKSSSDFNVKTILYLSIKNNLNIKIRTI